MIHNLETARAANLAAVQRNVDARLAAGFPAPAVIAAGLFLIGSCGAPSPSGGAREATTTACRKQFQEIRQGDALPFPDEAAFVGQCARRGNLKPVEAASYYSYLGDRHCSAYWARVGLTRHEAGADAMLRQAERAGETSCL